MCLGVVVPHYNQYDTLYESVGSLFKSPLHKKIVVVDDGSNFVPEGLGAYDKIPNEVSVIGFLDNHGVQISRNTGFCYLLRYGYEFTLFSDSDVIWAPNALNKLVDALCEGPGRKASYAYCDWNWGGKGLTAGDFDGNRLRQTNYISTMSVIRTQDLIKYAGAFPFDEELIRLQDWDLWLTLLKEGCTGIHVPECLFNTQFSEGGISNGPGYQEALNAITKKHHLKRQEQSHP